MKKLLLLALIVVLGGAILAPAIMAFEPDSMPGDFVLTLGNQHYPVPLIWSLCASGALGLLYLFYRR